MSTEPASRSHEDAEPDPKALWSWVGTAMRPWLGWILIGAGALLMLLGYLGVSREPLPAKQLPYLVSGGIGGMFLAVLGAFFLGTQELRRDSGRLDRLEQMVTELHLALLRRPDAPDPTVLAPAANGKVAPGPARKVFAVSGADLFHRRGCSMIDGKDAGELTPAAARKRGLEPCPLCAPAPAPLSAR